MSRAFNTGKLPRIYNVDSSGTSLILGAANSAITSSVWTKRGLDISNTQSAERNGYSVSINSAGNVVAVGASTFDTTNADAGRVRVFEWNGTAWVQRGSDIVGSTASENFGRSVSLSRAGNVVAIGAPLFSGGAGCVRVFEWNGTAWVQRGSDIVGTATTDQSGTSISIADSDIFNIEGDTVAIGAPFANTVAGTGSGRVRVFNWDGVFWSQRGNDINGQTANENFGTSVSLNKTGGRLAAGAPKNSSANPSAGRVRIFSRPASGAWIALGTINGKLSFDNFGSSVSLNAAGDVFAAGLPTADGKVRVYELSSTGSWTQFGFDIPGAAGSNSNFGYSVSISDDGNIVAIGAPVPGSPTKFGSVQVYKWDGSAWWLRAAEIVGTTAGLQAGFSVSINADGSVLAIGMPGNDTGTATSLARVYSWTGWEQPKIDFISDGVNREYSLRLSRGDRGTNAKSYIQHNGTGALNFVTEDAADIKFLQISPCLTVSASGFVATEKQPFFAAGWSSATINTTSNLIWSNVFINRGSNYNSSTGAFTAPVAGDYLFYFRALLTQSGSGRTDLVFHKNGAVAPGGRFCLQKPANVWYSLHGTIILVLAAGDTVSVRALVIGAGLEASSSSSCFSGYLLG